MNNQRTTIESVSNRILLVCGSSDTVINFRKPLVRFLLSRHYEVFLIVGDDRRDDEIKRFCQNIIYVPFSNRDTNPFSKKKLEKRIASAIKKIRPEIVFTFQATANIFGCLAAWKSSIKKIFAMVEGLGDPFEPKTLRGRIIKRIVVSLYRRALKHATRVFFLNQDDRAVFCKEGIVKSEQVCVIDGIGIDTKSVLFEKEIPPAKRVVCLARLIPNKGILEYCEIAKQVKQRRPDILFDLFGREDQITREDLVSYIDQGIINYRGFTNNSIEEIRQSRIVCSASCYREGYPMLVLEAMAVGRPVVAYNTLGFRDAITDGETGYLVKPHDIGAFASKIIELIDNDDLISLLGTNARQKCEAILDSDVINQKILDEIK